LKLTRRKRQAAKISALHQQLHEQKRLEKRLLAEQRDLEKQLRDLQNPAREFRKELRKL